MGSLDQHFLAANGDFAIRDFNLMTTTDAYERLPTLLWMVMQIIADQCDVQLSHVNDYIPGALFSTAVYSGVIPEPDGPAKGGVWLGDFKVTRELRDKFIESISETLDRAREIARGTPENVWADPWERPTPRDLIDDFRAKTGWSYPKIAEKARGPTNEHIRRREGWEFISDRTIRNIRNDPTYKVGQAIAGRLAVLMGLADWQLLRWRKKQKTSS